MMCLFLHRITIHQEPKSKRALSILTQNVRWRQFVSTGTGLYLYPAGGNHGDQLAVQWQVPCCEFSCFMVLTRDCSHSARQHIEVHCCSLHFHLSAGLQFSGKVVWWSWERGGMMFMTGRASTTPRSPFALHTVHNPAKARQGRSF